jgi:hypothetical protein
MRGKSLDWLNPGAVVAYQPDVLKLRALQWT